MSTKKSKIFEVTSLDDLDVLINKCTEENKILVVDTYAEWCGPCQMIAPFVAGLSINEHFKNWVTFAKVDVDQVEDVVMYLKVKSMPTFYVFHNSRVPKDILNGANKDELVKLLLKNKQLLNIE